MPTVTIPEKDNINRESGSLVLNVTHEALPTNEHLLTTGSFSLVYENNGITLSAKVPSGSTTKTESLRLEAECFPGDATVVWTWIGHNHRLSVLTADGFADKVFEQSALTSDFGLISLSETPYFKGSYQSLRIYQTDTFYTPIHTLLDELETKGQLLFQVNYQRGVHYEQPSFIETTYAPLDGSPILVNDENGPLRRQFFFDKDTAEYTETNTEHFLYKGENTLYASYDDLDADFETTAECKGELIGQPILVEGNQIHLNLNEEQKELFYGETITLTYKLNRSYTVEYNQDTAHDSLKIKLQQHKSENVTVTQEGNRFISQYLAREIELNPLVNPRHTGFLYIDKEEQASQSFRLKLSSNYIKADGLDTADFIVEVIDQEGNEVLSPYIDVYLIDDRGRRTTELGVLSPVVNTDTLKARNTSGRCYFKYHAPFISESNSPLTKRVFAVAYDRKHNIGAQFPILLRPVQNNVTSMPVRSVPVEAALPFEYLARFMNKEVPANHPVLELDSDLDGSLTRDDVLAFMKSKHNQTRMQELDHALREREVF